MMCVCDPRIRTPWCGRGDCVKPVTKPQLRELLADLEHDRWSRWMEYLFNQCESAEILTGRKILVMPEWAVSRWGRQMETSYADLNEAEKESDRKEADYTLDLLEKSGWEPRP